MCYIVIQSLKCHVIRLYSSQYALTLLLHTTLYFWNKFLKIHGGNELCDRSKVKGGRKKYIYIYIYYTYVKYIVFVDSYLFIFFGLTDAVSRRDYIASSVQVLKKKHIYILTIHRLMQNSTFPTIKHKNSLSL